MPGQPDGDLAAVVFDDAAGVQEPALEGVGGGRVVAGQATAQRGADGVGQDRERDVEVDVERDGAGDRVQAEGLDGFGEARCSMFIRRAQVWMTWRAGRASQLVISSVSWSWPKPVTAS